MAFVPIFPGARDQRMLRAGLWGEDLIIDRIDRVVATRPDQTAVVDLNSEAGVSTTLSFRQIDRLSRRVACALAGLGVGPGDVVAVQLPNWWHYFVLYPACARIGAVINPLMPIFRHRELSFMLGFAQTKVLVVPKTFRRFDHAAMAETLRKELPALRHVLVVGGDDPASAFDTVLLDPRHEDGSATADLFESRRPHPDDVTELMYTSGTTGEPKGVMHTANTLLCKARLAEELFELTPRDVVYMGSPLAHQTGFMYACLFTMVNGIKSVLQDVWEPVQAAQRIQDEGCTLTLGSTPFLSDLVGTAAVEDYDLSALRLFLCAGAPIPRVLLRRSAERFPNLYVMSAWGMTENGIVTATYPGDPSEKVFDTDGRALPHQQVRVIDAEGRVCAPGEEGRLQARGPTHFVGYFKRPEAYDLDDELWFETGDNARMDPDGYIRITGRSKDIIIRGGENVPVVEVEELLYRHDAIIDAAVIGLPDPRLGERGCAVVTLHAGTEFDFETMLAYLTECQLAKNYLPERLEIIDEFPRTASGKIQKFKLREWYTEGSSHD